MALHILQSRSNGSKYAHNGFYTFLCGRGADGIKFEGEKMTDGKIISNIAYGLLAISFIVFFIFSAFPKLTHSIKQRRRDYIENEKHKQELLYKIYRYTINFSGGNQMEYFFNEVVENSNIPVKDAEKFLFDNDLFLR